MIVLFANYGQRGPAGRSRGGVIIVTMSDIMSTLTAVHMERSHKGSSR